MEVQIAQQVGQELKKVLEYIELGRGQLITLISIAKTI